MKKGLLFFTLRMGFVFVSGCSHQLRITNLND